MASVELEARRLWMMSTSRKSVREKASLCWLKAGSQYDAKLRLRCVRCVANVWRDAFPVQKLTHRMQFMLEFTLINVVASNHAFFLVNAAHTRSR